ncbi:MAG: porin family protein [Sphingobacteriaceae bacterium]|nr:porin family protein [Sphingobacteriaceae bacterium]
MYKYLFFFLFLVSYSQSQAQSGDSKYRFGLHFTPNRAWVMPETRLLNQERGGYGYGYGLLIERKIGSNYFFSTGLSINQLQYGSSLDTNIYVRKNTLPAGFNNIQYQYRAQYFELPLSMKMRTNQMGAIRIYGQFGINTAVLFQARAKITNIPGEFDPEEYFFINKVTDYKNDLTTDDRVSVLRAGIIIGAGVEYLLSGETHLVLGVRLDNPFTDNYRGDAVNGRVPSIGLQVGIFF